MTYIKLENNMINYPPLTMINGKECISPFTNNIPKMVEYGYFDCDQSVIDEYNAGILSIVNNEFVENPDWENEQQVKETARINNLTMTALDFINFLVAQDLTLEQINAYLESNLSAKMQLTYCQNVYCGVAKALMPITLGEIIITAQMVENAFKVKNGEIINE